MVDKIIKSTAAPDSLQVERARRKLERKLEKADALINPEALNLMKDLLHTQRATDKSPRINLKKRAIQPSAKPQSKIIRRLVDNLQHANAETNSNKLTGRITPFND